MADGQFDLHVDISQCDAFFTEIADPARVKKITRKALRKGAMVIRDAVAARAPERPDLPSGTALPIGALKNDIIVKSSTDDNGRETASVQPGALTDHVAGWVEYGHQQVAGGKLGLDGKGKGHRVGTHGMTSTFVPAHPFFRPAEEESEAAANDAIAESLSEDLVSEKAPSADSEAA
jgi:HK97 gp10 family phage protein